MIEIRELIDAGDDVLIVRARDSESGEEREAAGWVSATTNHFDADAYDADGNRDERRAPRAMTAGEVGEYALGLLGVALPAPPAAAVAFEIPATLADVARKAPVEEVPKL